MTRFSHKNSVKDYCSSAEWQFPTVQSEFSFEFRKGGILLQTDLLLKINSEICVLSQINYYYDVQTQKQRGETSSIWQMQFYLWMSCKN